MSERVKGDAVRIGDQASPGVLQRLPTVAEPVGDVLPLTEDRAGRLNFHALPVATPVQPRLANRIGQLALDGRLR